MRVLIVSQYFWPESFRINEIALALRDEGCDVMVLTGQPNYPEGVSFRGYSWWSIGSEKFEGLTIFRVPLIPRGKAGAMRLALNYLSFIIFATFIGPFLLRGQEIDRIFVFGLSPILQAIPGIWLAHLKRAPLITWVQDLWPESLSVTGFVSNKMILKMVSRLVCWIYRKSDLILVQSLAFIDPVKKMAGPTPVRYHPNPGDFAFSMTENDCPPPFSVKSGFNVVFAGNMGAVQSLDTILGAAEILRQDKSIKLIMVGGGSRVEWLMSEVVRRGLTNIDFQGRLPLSFMPAIMAQASALLVSLSRGQIMSQTIPSKIQAYLAAGRPIIASLDGEGGRIILEAGAGVVAPSEDVRGLANAILELSAMGKDELAGMGQKARTYYEENFEPRLLAQKLKKLLAMRPGEF
ncbi:glycosyltransferase family 4 protein [Polynucleobacter sp. MWH-S4W17]|uniref:glycosyltransferase family 4 protein n=1 Tax=Polynucleobacter sp. MWH-S4W17 TaxID=1855910 RepID=UPI001BFD7DDD|nr:glycosyltransferase family 4 protein [Polynucleobacter sp. MWH-S4W17]QWD81942.1 glycosyltransferase family 4 protein [Polynucleobacter sp. MWH-S4W17]